jgi:molybdopterin-binding protein
MSEYRIGQAAELLGVSSDTVRRWVDADELESRRTDGGHRVIDGPDLARMAAAHNEQQRLGDVSRSARNRFVGLVTDVKVEGLVAQVEIQAGPHRVVSLLTSEAVRDLDLKPGELAMALVKSTNVIIEVVGEQ